MGEAAMFAHIAAADGAFFKSSLRGQPEMTTEEKLAILKYNYETKPGAFLTRYAQFMRMEHLDNFDPESDEYKLAIYMREISRAAGRLNLSSPPTSPLQSPTSPPVANGLPKISAKAKNRRYNAIRRLIKEGDYFSDAEMKARAPLLYEQLVGRYLSEGERQAEFHTGACSGDSQLSSLLTRLADGEAESVRRAAAEAAEGAEEGPAEAPISALEKARLRAELTSAMHERFLGGADAEWFEYATVDDNSDFDPLDLIARDKEDAYFDGEEPS